MREKALWVGRQRILRLHSRLMPYFQERSAPLLEHVYVELQLDPERMREAAGTDLEVHHEARLLSRRMSIRDVLDIDPTRNRWITRRWLLRGDPGSGKTTLLRYLAWTLVDAGGKPRVPVFESLPRLMADRLSIFGRIEEDLGRADQPGAEICRFLEEEAGEVACCFYSTDSTRCPGRLGTAPRFCSASWRHVGPRARLWLYDLLAPGLLGLSSWNSKFCLSTPSAGARSRSSGEGMGFRVLLSSDPRQS